MDGDPAAVEHHLRGLPPERLAAFVEDLWVARGYETRREDGLIVATREDRSVTLAIPGLGSGLHRIGGGIDVVVAPRGVADVAELPADQGARVLDAADLHAMLQYAVDRETACVLVERHLGGPPADLRPPGGTGRVLASLDGIPGSLRIPELSRAAPLAFIVAVAVILAFGGFALVDGAPGGGSPGGPVTPGQTPAAVPTETERPAVPGLGRVPGLRASGITDPEALARAHDRAPGSRYVVWMDIYWGLAGTGRASGTQRDVDVRVADDRYLLVAEEEQGRSRRPVLSVYHDGSSRHVATYENRTANYTKIEPGAHSPAWVPEPGELRSRFVTGYLSTGETNVTGIVEGDDGTYYKLVAAGTPPGPVPGLGPDPVGPESVENYTVVALVDSRGFVAELDARYRVPGTDGPVPVRFQATYDRRGSATVRAPDWYRRAVENGSRTTGDQTG